MTNRVVIVGAGQCGVSAAFTLRELGFDGEIMLVGEEAHLPYERPPLSKSAPVVAKAITSEEAYRAASIELLRSQRVTAIDRETKRVTLSDHVTLAYQHLLLATGATPRIMPSMEGAMTLRTLDDATAIFDKVDSGMHLAIVGGGFIGLELAATARRVGAAVTVIELAEQLMGRAVPPVIASVAEQRHRDEGVRIILGAKVIAATPTYVELESGRRIEADLVVAGIGAIPNTQLASSARLEVDNGIRVNASLVTSDPSIFAAGDCCNFPWAGQRIRLESWRVAKDQGAQAARAMTGHSAAHARNPWFWSDQYDLTLQVAGIVNPSWPFIRRDLGDGAFIVFQTSPAGTLRSACGIGVGNGVGKDIRLAEMLMERGVAPSPEALADPAIPLKRYLKRPEPNDNP